MQLMGLYDVINLAEPLPCFACDSTAQDNVGTTIKKQPLAIGGIPLTIIVLHDGKGGLKNFQTKDIECLLKDYWFPGFVPAEDINQGENGVITLSDLYEACNACSGEWFGELELRRQGPIYKATSLTIHPAPGVWGDIHWKIPSSDDDGCYRIEKGEGYIRLVPNAEPALLLYPRNAAAAGKKREVYRTFLTSMRHPKVPLQDIIELLDEESAGVENPCYDDELADALVHQEREKEIAKFTEGAFYAALFILYRCNQDQALQLVDMSGITSRTDFVQEFSSHRWYFERPRKRKVTLLELRGINGGPNMFLHHLKKLEMDRGRNAEE